MRAAVWRAVRGLPPERQAEHLCDVSGVGRQHLGVLLVAEVGLVGQSDAGLGEVHQVAGRVLGIGIDVHADAAAHPGALQRADDGGQLVGVGGVVDRGQLGRAAVGYPGVRTASSLRKLA